MNPHHHITLPEFFERLLPAGIANGAAIAVSLQSEIEGWLRIISLLAAITYTVILSVKAIKGSKPRP